MGAGKLQVAIGAGLLCSTRRAMHGLEHLGNNIAVKRLVSLCVGGQIERFVNFDKMLLLPLLSNPKSRKELSCGDPDKVCPAKWPVKLRRWPSYTLWSQVACPAVLSLSLYMYGISPTLPHPPPPVPPVSHPTLSPLFFALPIESIDTHSRYLLLRFDLSPLPGLVHSFQHSHPHFTLTSPAYKLRTYILDISSSQVTSKTTTTNLDQTKQNSSILPKMKKITIAAVVALASQAFADPLPYRPAKAFLSAREIFGLGRRETDDVYHPKQSVCGMAETCSEACGNSFAQCASTDNQMHCYDKGAKEACCPDGTGNSCEAGYYCAADTAGLTVCCPEGDDLAACASKYSVAGGLHFETKIFSSSAASSTSTSSASTSTSVASSSTSSSAVTSAPAAPSGGVFFETGNSTTAAAPSGTVTGGSGGASKTSAGGSSTASATGSTTNGAGVASPASVLALLSAAGLVAFL